MAVTCGMVAVFDVFSLGVEMPIGASKWAYGFWVWQNGTEGIHRIDVVSGDIHSLRYTSSSCAN